MQFGASDSTFLYNSKRGVALMRDLIKILNWDQNPERAAAANWGMVSAGGGSGAYSSPGKLEALRNNGMWVYLSPQINGTHGSANYLSDCGQYQVVHMNIVFTLFICLVFFIQPVLHVLNGLKKSFMALHDMLLLQAAVMRWKHY